MRKFLLIILVSVFVLSCNSDDNNSSTTNVESTLIAKDALGGNGDEGIVQQNMVITDQGVWESLITQMNTVNNESDKFSEIDIDFSEFTIIVAFDEIRESSGYSVELNITSNSQNITVIVKDFSPNGNTLAVMNQPYHIVKILNSDLPIVFE